MRRTGNIVIILILLSCSIGDAIAQKRNTLVIADDHLILKIDLKSPRNELDSIFKVAGISESMVEKVAAGDFAAMRNEGWNNTTRQGDIVQFDRSLNDINSNPQSRPYLVTTRLPRMDGKPGYPEKVKYGVNKYALITVYELPSGLTRFILPGFQNIKRVLLAGNFNNWSTLKGLMKKTEGGWMIDIKLEPGAYQYKYIINGGWRTDPNNLLQVDDGTGNLNSVYYKYNYKFKLNGYAAAHRITVAGDFNKWNPNELIMEKTGNNWERDLYLDDGMHVYRFMVDGQWITDPGNPVKLKDEKNSVNSVINLGETVNFKLLGYSNASKVFVAGNFNDWRPADLSLQKTGDSWILPFILTPGNYQYKFIVDGKWITDPSNPHYAMENGQRNSFLSVKPNHTFKLQGFNDAKSVVVTGTFDDWDPNGITLAHIGNEWMINFYLKPGKCLYKFRVDGRWIIDPGNKLWEQNQPGTGNSVFWME